MEGTVLGILVYDLFGHIRLLSRQLDVNYHIIKNNIKEVSQLYDLEIKQRERRGNHSSLN